MVKQLLAIAIALLAATSARAAPPVRTMYERALENEQTVRLALLDPAASAAVLKSVRRAIVSYESIARRHPTSAYSDNALWQAGHLALAAFDRFGDAQDKETGLRLLRWLAAEYPTSKLARQVPDVLARQGGSQAPSVQAATAGARPATARPATTATGPAFAAGNGLQAVSGSAAVSKPAAYAGAPSPSSATVLKPATITDIRRAVFPDVVRVTIALDNEVPFHEERIDGPSRIFIDFPSTRATAALTDQTLRFDDSEIVRQVKIGRHPNVTTRVVLDATGVTSYSVYPIYNPYRLVIDCLRPTAPAPRVAQVTPTAAVATLPPRAVHPKPEISAKASKPEAIDRIPDTPKRLASRRLISTWARALPYSTPLSTAALNRAYVPPLSVRRFDVDWGRQLPLAAPTSAALIAQALAQEAATVVASVLPSAPLPSASPALSASSASPLSMARQLGLGVSRIVIDPGHGGHDSGAKGKGGVSEAELVLDVSLRLQKLLEKVQGVEVILTRQTDCFVSLPERTAIANREGADLFLSVHANASANDQAHGVETYFLDFANNLGAAAVAARENAASGQAMGALPDFVKAIALNNKLDESRDFAALVQQSMVDRLRLTNKTVKNLGVKQAPFVVLIGASMPSVLAEISFVTNPQEAKLLKSNAYRQSVAEALFAAVRKYQTSLTPTRTVASQ